MSATKKMLFGKYEIGKLLGCGAFAKVYHGRDVSNGKSVAIKCFNKNKIQDSNLTSNIKTEISIMRRLRHQNIVRLFEVLASRNKIYFVIEFVKGGELFTRIEKTGRVTENVARGYFRQLISAVGYCHSRGVFHRDLKPENVLIDDKGDLKITDFGLSAVKGQVRKDGMFHTWCGTPAYVAPEILRKRGYDGAMVDIWSCGIILFVIIAGYLPFNDSNLIGMYKKICNGTYRCPKWASPELKHLISRLLDTNTDTRISIDEILNDPWFVKDLGKEELEKLSRFHSRVEKMEKKVEIDVSEEMNAFDIIALSTGFSLSGLFEPDPTQERFICSGQADSVLQQLEDEWMKERSMDVERRQRDGVWTGLNIRGRTGKLSSTVVVYRLNREMVVVEVVFYDDESKARGRPALSNLRC